MVWPSLDLLHLPWLPPDLLTHGVALSGSSAPTVATSRSSTDGVALSESSAPTLDSYLVAESYIPSCSTTTWVDLSPIPSANRRYVGKRRCQSSRILTNHYDDQIPEDESGPPKQKKRKVKNKPKPSECKYLEDTSAGLSKQKRERRKAVSSVLCEEAEYPCIFCGEIYVEPPNEDWIKCHKCNDWCHEKCANNELSSDNYICDFCQRN